VLTIAILVVHLLTSTCRSIFLILMHSGKGGGLSDMFGGSVGQAAAGSTVVEKNLDRITITVAVDLRLHHGHPGSAPAVTRRVFGVAPARPARRPSPRSAGAVVRAGHVPVTATVFLVVLLAACASPSSTAASGSSSSVTSSTVAAPLLVAGRGGTATVALDAIPTTLNDHTVVGDTEATRIVASTVWVQVFQIGPGLKPALDTAVVQSAEVVSVNPQTVVYQIAPQAVWSDGVHISAADFQYAWQAQRGGATDVDGTPDSVASTLGYRDIASVVSSNHGRTATVTFHTPFADWESLFDDLLPAHIAEAVGWNHGFDTFDPHVLVSGGPWLIKKWTPGQRIVLARNPRWWGPAPRFNRIVLEAAPGTAALAGAMRRGRVQVVDSATFDASLISQLSAQPKVETQTNIGATMLQLDFNVRHSPLDSELIREGIAHAIDRVGIVTRVTQPLQHDAWLDNSHLFANLQSNYVDNASGYETVDTATADALLAQGGLVADPDGTWTLHGTPVTLDLTWADDDPWSAAVGPLLAGQLVGVGFDVDTTPVPTSQLFGAVLPTATFDLALVPVPASAYLSQLGRGLLAHGHGRQRQPGPGLDRLRRSQGRRSVRPGAGEPLRQSGGGDLSADRSGPVGGHAHPPVVGRTHPGRVLGVTGRRAGRSWRPGGPVEHGPMGSPGGRPPVPSDHHGGHHHEECPARRALTCAPPHPRPRDSRRSGGIGRRASLRGWCPQGRRGSSPLSDTVSLRLNLHSLGSSSLLDRRIALSGRFSGSFGASRSGRRRFRWTGRCADRCTKSSKPSTHPRGVSCSDLAVVPRAGGGRRRVHGQAGVACRRRR
jgi:peptide/nickel transport system substrate-binding protein